jgi:glutamate synthase domain-containing protein 3
VERRHDARELTASGVNRALRAEPGAEHVVDRPDGLHNLAVGVSGTGRVRFAGHVGAYCGGMNDGFQILVDGSAGWGLGENCEAGTILVDGCAAAGAGASMRGGAVVVRGDADVRAGVGKKGGLLVIGGEAGGMCGFMAQVGHIVVAGDARRGVGDSMYEGRVLVGGAIREAGSDTRVERTLDDEDEAALMQARALLGEALDHDWQRIVAGRRLWHFTKENMAMWRSV